MATMTMNYASAAAITCPVESIASSATLVAGCESTIVDNTTNKYINALVSGKVTVGTTPTINTAIYVYAFAMLDDSTYPDVFEGTGSAETLTSVGVMSGVLKLIAVMSVDAVTSDRAYFFGPVAIASAFGGILPKKWGLYVAHNTGVNLNSTGTNHVFNYVGVKLDSA